MVSDPGKSTKKIVLVLEISIINRLGQTDLLPYKCQSRMWISHDRAHVGQKELHYVEQHLLAAAT